MFKDGLSLYTCVENSFPEKIREILDLRIMPCYGNRDEEAAVSIIWDQKKHQMSPGTMSYITALVKLGLLCAAETPKDWPVMQDVYADAITIKEAFPSLQGWAEEAFSTVSIDWPHTAGA
jgi:hypothetical protein